jgi:hypothetical protein
VPASSFASTTVELECVLPLDEAVDHVGHDTGLAPKGDPRRRHTYRRAAIELRPRCVRSALGTLISALAYWISLASAGTNISS